MHSWFREARSSRWWRVVSRALARWDEVDGDQHAASLAWYLVLSLLPLLILMVTLFSVVIAQEEAARELVQWAKQYAPLTVAQERDAVDAVRRLLDTRSHLNILAFGLLIWNSLNFLTTLVKTTNRIWQAPAYNWWRLPLKSLALLGVTVSTVLIGVLLPGFARLVQSWLSKRLAIPDWAFAALFQFLPWVVMFYGLIMMYRLAPSRSTTFTEVWMGALVATGLIWIGESLFLVYIYSFASSNLVYGALGGLVIILLWIYFFSSACIFGVCLCAARATTNRPDRKEASPPSHPSKSTPAH